jgi:hypothetical protein
MTSSRLFGIHFSRAAQTKLPDAELQVAFHLQEHLPHVGDPQLAVPVLLQKPRLTGGCYSRPSLLVGEITAVVTYDVLGAGWSLMVADADRARARTRVTSMQILSRRICHTSPRVHGPAEKGVPPSLGAVGKKCPSARPQPSR